MTRTLSSTKESGGCQLSGGHARPPEVKTCAACEHATSVAYPEGNKWTSRGDYGSGVRRGSCVEGRRELRKE